MCIPLYTTENEKDSEAAKRRMERRWRPGRVRGDCKRRDGGGWGGVVG